jgi:hypothetical protein
MNVAQTHSELKSAVGKTIADIQTIASNKTNDIVIVIFYTDGTFTAIAPNPDETVLKTFIEATNMNQN